jgi:tRNA U54 and U55 pseudouridine synthase Pus10
MIATGAKKGMENTQRGRVSTFNTAVDQCVKIQNQEAKSNCVHDRMKEFFETYSYYLDDLDEDQVKTLDASLAKAMRAALVSDEEKRQVIERIQNATGTHPFP